MPIQNPSQSWDPLIRLATMAHLSDGATLGNDVAERRARQIERAAAGCNHARSTLLREIESPCYRFCLMQLACPHRARDATQETALRLLRSLHRFRGESSLTTWALSIALNVCREQQRRKRWLPLPHGLAPADPAPGPHDRIDHREQQRQLTLALQQLPRRQREAVTLRYLQGLSTAETARAMRCAEGTVKATLAKAIRNLRQAWGPNDG